MKFTEVAELTQNALAQSMGSEYMGKLGDFSALSDYQLVDVGRDVLDSGSVESVTKALISQCARIEIISDRYEKRLKNLFVNADEWGGFLERAYFSLTDVLDDDMYKLVDGTNYGEREHTFYKPKASARIFEEGKAIVLPISITVDQFKEAFTGWANLNKYLSGIRQSVRNTLEISLDAYAHMLMSCGIAVSCKATNTAVHLLTEAKALGIVTEATTAKTAMTNKDFLTYCVKRVNDVKEYITTMTTAFNNKSIPTFASEAEAVMLYDFMTAVNYFVKPTNYSDAVNLGNIDTVVKWQGTTKSSNNFDFDTISSISISADSENKLGIGTEAVNLSNVIGLVYDRRALGISLFKEKITSSYTANADFWNEFLHVLLNYIIDANLSMVAFVLD